MVEGKATVMELTEDQIQACFTKYDADSSGDLDTFELSNAVTELLNGVVPTTSQVTAMVALSGAQDNKLSRDQFSSLIKHFDWSSAAATAALGDLTYEHIFQEKSLGFRVRSVAGRGIIVVSKVVEPSLAGVVNENDTVLAVNGAPLGFVTDHKVLQEKIKPLRRPVRVTFQKYVEGSSDAMGANLEASSSAADYAPVGDSTADGESEQASLTTAGAAGGGGASSIGDDGSVKSGGVNPPTLIEAAPAAGNGEEVVGDVMSGGGGGAQEPSPRSAATIEAVEAGRRRAEADAAQEEEEEVKSRRSSSSNADNSSKSPNVSSPPPASKQPNDEGPISALKDQEGEVGGGGGTLSGTTLWRKDWPHEVLYSAFQTYDRDRSGNLDTFELGPCLRELLGTAPSTAVVHALVDRYDQGGNGTVDLVSFIAMMRDFDWSVTAEESEHAQADAQLLEDQGLYEVDFQKSKLGFKVRNDPTRPGEIAVSAIMDADNEGRIHLGDGVLAVNGAPLGYANDHRILAFKIKDLSRPLRLTFRRKFNEAPVAAEEAAKKAEKAQAVKQQLQAGNEESKLSAEDGSAAGGNAEGADREGQDNSVKSGDNATSSNDDDDDDDASVLSISVASLDRPHFSLMADSSSSSSATLIGNGFTFEQLSAAFREFDVDFSNALDTFELSACLASLVKRPITTPEMVRLVHEFDEHETNTLDFGEFLRMFREHDFSKEVEEELGEGVYEVSFAEQSLGIKVANVPVKDPTTNEPTGAEEITVIEVVEPSLQKSGVIAVGDAIIAVNGAPLAAVGHHRALADKIAPLGRPLRLTFTMSTARLAKLAKLAAREARAEAKEEAQRRRAEASALASGVDVSEVPELQPRSRTPSRTLSSRVSLRIGSFDEPLSPKSPKGLPPDAVTSPSRGRTMTGSSSSSKPGTPKSPGSRAESVNASPKLGWKAALMAVDLEKIRLLKARLQELSLSESKRGDGSTFSRTNSISSRGGKKKKRRASLSDQGHEIVPLGDAAAPSLGAQACLIEAGKLCLKLVKRNVLGGRMDTSATLRTACVCLDRAMAGSELPGCYANRPELPPTQPSTVTTAAAAASGSSNVGSPTRSRRSRSPSEPFYSPGIPTKVIGRRDSIGNAGDGSGSDDGDAPDDGEDGPDGAPLPEKEANQEERQHCADGYYWAALAEAHWRCFEMGGLRGEGIHLVRAAEAYARATQSFSHLSDTGLWLQSLKPLVGLGAWERAAHTCGALPDMPLSPPDLPPSFQFQAAELFVALSMHETAHSYLFAAFVETGPPVSLKPEHLLFALGRVFNMWHHADLAEGGEESGHGDHASALLMQACQLTLSAKTHEAKRKSAAAAAAAGNSGGSTAVVGGNGDDDELPAVTPDTLAAWLADGATLRGFGDAYTAAGFHLLAHDCYRAAVHDCSDSGEARKPVAWYRLAKSCFFTGQRPEAVAALTRAVELQQSTEAVRDKAGGTFDNNSGSSSANTSANSSRCSSVSGGYSKLLAEWQQWDEPGYDGGAWAYERELRQPLDKLASRLPVLGEDHDSTEANGAASTLSATFRSHQASKQALRPPPSTTTNGAAPSNGPCGLQRDEEDQAPRLYRSNSELENVEENDGESLADETLSSSNTETKTLADSSPAPRVSTDAAVAVKEAPEEARALSAPSKEPSVQEAALVTDDAKLQEAAPKFARQPSMQERGQGEQDELTQQVLRDLNEKLAAVEAERDAAKALASSSQAELQEARSRPQTPAQATAQAQAPAATAEPAADEEAANNAEEAKAAREKAAADKKVAEEKKGDEEKAAEEKKVAEEKASAEKAAAEKKAAEEKKTAVEAKAKREAEDAAKAIAEAEEIAAAARKTQEYQRACEEAAVGRPSQTPAMQSSMPVPRATTTTSAAGAGETPAVGAATAPDAQEYQRACKEAAVGRPSETPAMRPSPVSTDTRATYVEEAAAASASRPAKSPMMQSTTPAIPADSRDPAIVENDEGDDGEGGAAATSPAASDVKDAPEVKNKDDESTAALEAVAETPALQAGAPAEETLKSNSESTPTLASAPAPESTIDREGKTAVEEEAAAPPSTVEQTKSEAALAEPPVVATALAEEKDEAQSSAPLPSANAEPAKEKPIAIVNPEAAAAAQWEGWRLSNTGEVEVPEGYAAAPTTELSSSPDEHPEEPKDTAQPPTAAEVARMPELSKQLETEQLEAAGAFKTERREPAMRPIRPSVALVVARQRESWEEDLSVEKLELMESPTRVIEPRDEFLLAPPGDSSMESQSDVASLMDATSLETQREELPAAPVDALPGNLDDKATTSPEVQQEGSAPAFVVASPDNQVAESVADPAAAAAADGEPSPEPPQKAKKPRKSKAQKAKEKHLMDKSPEAVRARLYRRMFVSLDVNQDGSLTRVEIAAALSADARLCAVVHEACGFPEGLALPSAAVAAGGGGGDAADADKRSKNDLSGSNGTSGEESSVAQFDRVFDAIDLDATGDISFEEFVEFVVRRKAIMEAMVLQGGDPQAAIAAAAKADEKKKERDAMLAALFGAVDRNGDGDVTRSELMRALNNEAHLRVMLQKLLGLPSKVGTKAAKESFEMVFACVDRDHSHSIVVDELRTFLEDMDHMVAMQGDKSLPRDVQELLVSADKNQDGDLSPIEVIRALHAHPELLKALEMRKAQVAFLESEGKKAALLGAAAARKAAEKASRNRTSPLTEDQRAAGMMTPLRMSTPVLQVPQAYERPLSSTSPPRGGAASVFSGRLSPSDRFDASDALSRGSSFGTFSSDGGEDDDDDDMATTDASASTGESTTYHTTMSDSVDYFSRDSAGQSQEGGRGGGGDDGFSVASGNVSFNPEEQDLDWQRDRPSGSGNGSRNNSNDLVLPALAKDADVASPTTSPGKKASKGNKAGGKGGKRGKAARLAAEKAAREQAQQEAARAAEEEARLEAQRLLPPIETPEQKKARLARQKAEQEQQKAAAKRLARSGYRSQRQDTLDARIDAAMRATPGALPFYLNPSVAASLASSFAASSSSSSAAAAVSPPAPPVWPYQGQTGSFGSYDPEQSGSFSFGHGSAWYGNNNEVGGGGSGQDGLNNGSSVLDGSSLNLSGVLGPVAASSLVPYHQVSVVQLGAWARDSRDPELRRAARQAASVAAASMKRCSKGGKGRGGGGGGSKKRRPAPMAEALRHARAARAPGGAAATLAVEAAAQQRQQQLWRGESMQQQAHQVQQQQQRARSEGSVSGNGSQMFRTLSLDGNNPHLGSTQPAGSWGAEGRAFDQARF